jgi:RNA polymerase sigma factor (sigma-70 family)
MRPSATVRATVWAAAISVTAAYPHAVFAALVLAVAKEGFDLLHARMNRIAVLSYIRALSTGTYLSVEPSGAFPGVTLHTALSAGSPGDQEGVVSVPADDQPSRSGTGLDPGEFCIKNRSDWLAYALGHARNLPDAEDAVQHVAVKILEQHARTGTLCPPGYDPIAWSKTVIANYIKDRHRHARVQVKHQGKLYSPPNDFVEDLIDNMIAKQGLSFIKGLKPADHQIAEMHYAENLEPRVIAERLQRNVVTVRTSLWRTNRRIRRQLGIATEPQRIIPRRETT